MNWSRISAFLGFLRLPPEQGGFGQVLAKVQTLARLCVPEAIEAFLLFSSQRSGGLKHEGHRTFCNTVASLTREKYGYLRQNQHLFSKLPDGIAAGRTSDFMCDEAHATAEAWAATATDTSRNPQDGIAFFLEQKQPLRPIFDAMHRIRRLADGCMPGSISEALLRRDELMLGFFTSNPLRAKNVKTLTWKPDNSGHVYRTPSGQWRLRIEPREFKNRNGGKNKNRKKYDVAIAAWLKPCLEGYLERFRAVLCGEHGHSPFLFLNSRTGGRMNDMNRRLYEITKRFIPRSGGISPHAFRHLIATVWLEEHPNDFFVVSELLNDSLQVVLNTYAHLKKDTSFSKYEAFVSSMV
jgi:integrase